MGIDTRTITVTDTGTSHAPPEVAVVTFAIEVRRSRAHEAYHDAAEAARSLVQLVSKAGVPKQSYTTGSLELRAETVWTQEQVPRVSGYTCATSLVCRLGFDKNPEHMIAQAVQEVPHEALRLQGLIFEAGQPAQAQRQARAQAWRRAYERAEHYAALAGCALGEVLTVRESGDELASGPLPMTNTAAGAPLPVSGGGLSVTATVTVTWQLCAS